MRRDQCRAGPGDDKRTAAQHSTASGLDRISNIPPKTRSMARFHVGSRQSESAEEVVTVVVAIVVTVVLTIVLTGKKHEYDERKCYRRAVRGQIQRLTKSTAELSEVPQVL